MARRRRGEDFVLAGLCANTASKCGMQDWVEAEERVALAACEMDSGCSLKMWGWTHICFLPSSVTASCSST